MTHTRLRSHISSRLIREFLALHEVSGKVDKQVESSSGVISHLRHGRYRSTSIDTLEAMLNALGHTLKIERIEE